MGRPRPPWCSHADHCDCQGRAPPLSLARSDYSRILGAHPRARHGADADVRKHARRSDPHPEPHGEHERAHAHLCAPHGDDPDDPGKPCGLPLNAVLQPRSRSAPSVELRPL